MTKSIERKFAANGDFKLALFIVGLKRIPVMKTYILPVFLQIIGFFVIMAEIFIPSFGILTVLAICIFFYSLYTVFTSVSATAGIIFTGVDVVIIPVMIIIGIKILSESKLTLKLRLSKQDGVVSQEKGIETFINKEGKAVTDLRPAGIAMIDSKRLDVVTDAEYIDAGTPVIVTNVTGNRIVVEKIK